MWTIMTLLALWHVLRVRRPGTALQCKGVTEYYGSSADDENEFKTGKHTYARWNNGGDTNKEVTEDELVDVKEMDEYNVAAVTDDDDNNDGEIYDNDEEDDNDDEDDDNYDENNAENPLLDALKKVYTAVFFYGLEEPAPNPEYRNKVNRMNQRNRRKAIPSARKLKSPFFTKGEQKAYFLLLNDQEYPLDVENKGKSPPLSGSDSSFMGDEDIFKQDEDVYNQDDGSAPVREYAPKNNELEELDNQLRNYSEKLKSLDRKIQEMQTTCPSDERLLALQSQRDQVTSVIEDIQIRYVTVKSLRSE